MKTNKFGVCGCATKIVSITYHIQYTPTSFSACLYSSYPLIPCAQGFQQDFHSGPLVVDHCIHQRPGVGLVAVILQEHVAVALGQHLPGWLSQTEFCSSMQQCPVRCGDVVEIDMRLTERQHSLDIAVEVSAWFAICLHLQVKNSHYSQKLAHKYKFLQVLRHTVHTSVYTQKYNNYTYLI